MTPNIGNAIKELGSHFFQVIGEEPTNETEYNERVTFYSDATAETEITAPLTWEQVETKQNELTVAWTNIAYQRERAEKYALVEQQLDNLWHDIDEGKLDNTGSFFLGNKAVKDADPK
jgi:hypothetical protein